MKKFYLIKTGSTFPATAQCFGDFDRWTASALCSTSLPIEIVDAECGAMLPPAEDCAGVAITGSHAMVTDNLPWSLRLEAWIPHLLEAHVPLLGICYGHQLLARAAGGKVGFHPQGLEVGTVMIDRLPSAEEDPLFRALPASFSAHVTHSQTVLTLPTDAYCLASNDFEPHHAFRLGDCAWGVQFHPEYSTDIMRSYIEAQTDELLSAGQDATGLLRDVKETPVAAEIARRFGQIVKERVG